MAISPRRAREIARTRQDILDAAARALAASGFNGATMQDIAREAGYTAASLYSYFSSKEEIIRELFHSILRERMAIRSMPMPADLNARQKLEIFLRRQFDFARRHRDVIRFFLLSGGLPSGILPTDLEGCPPCVPQAGATPLEVSANEFAAFFAEHVSREELAGWSAEDAGLAFSGLAHGFFLRWLRAGDDEPAKAEDIPLLVEFFFAGLAAAAKLK